MRLFGKVFGVITALLMIVEGLYCSLYPDVAALGLGWFVGASMVINALGDLFVWGSLKKAGAANGWMLAGALLSLIAGACVLGSTGVQFALDVFMAYIVAAWIILTGILRIVAAFGLRNFHWEFNTKELGANWWVLLILGVLLLIVGIFALVNPFVTIVAMGVLIGLSIVVAGINLLVFSVAI